MKKLIRNINLSISMVIMAASCSHDDFKGRNQWDGLYTEDTILVSKNLESYESGNQFIDSISYLILEYLDDYPVGEVSNLLFMDDYIVVIDQHAANAVYLFSYDGKFKRQISSQGTGPGEYVHLTYVTLSYDRKEIVIQDRSTKKMMWFDINGRLTRTKGIPGYSGNIDFIGENTWITDIYPSNRNITKKGRHPFFIVTDSVWNYKYSLDYSKKFQEPFKVVPNPIWKSYASDKMLGFIASDNRIYCFTEDSAYVTHRFLIEGEENDLGWEETLEAKSRTEFSNQNCLVHPILDCGDYVSFILRQGENGSIHLYNKNNGNTYIMSILENGNLMYAFFDQIFFCKKNTLIAQAFANEFYSNVNIVNEIGESPLFSEIAEKVNPESNPVLIFYHLK